MDGRAVPATKTGTFYLEPSEMATFDNSCAQSHDSGPFLRTPYVMRAEAQVAAFAKANRNKSTYSLPGDNLLHWNDKIFRLKITGDTTCSGACHTMDANTIDPTVGTSSLSGLYSGTRRCTTIRSRTRHKPTG